MSATTPEAKVKNKIKWVLDKYRNRIYVYMAVPGGYGQPTLDYLGIANGYGFAIEAKRPGAEPTDRQKATIERIEKSGARVFVINDDKSLEELDYWLEEVCYAGHR